MDCAAIPMYDLLDIACAAMAALELDKISEKEHAFKHVMNRVYGYMTPPARALNTRNGLSARAGNRRSKIVLP